MLNSTLTTVAKNAITRALSSQRRQMLHHLSVVSHDLKPQYKEQQPYQYRNKWFCKLEPVPSAPSPKYTPGALYLRSSAYLTKTFDLVSLK